MRELAAMLRVSTSTVYQAVAAGEIPHVRVNNAIRVALPDVRRSTSNEGKDEEPSAADSGLAPD